MKKRDTFWRGHPAGIWIVETAARWVAEQANFRGLSLHDYVEGRCSLTDLGVTVENAEATLQPLMPFGHLAYEAWSGRDETFDSWKDWYVRLLLSRIRYFFLKHRGTRTYRCWGEWPLPIPPRLIRSVLAAAEWSTWRFQVRLQHPPETSPAPATQPFSRK